MPETAVRSYSTKNLNTYKEQEIVLSSPEKCVLHLYDLAIQGCLIGDQERARKALKTLIDALNFEAGGEVAMRLFGLYEYCLRLVHDKQFALPKTILQGLRDTWQKMIGVNLEQD